MYLGIDLGTSEVKVLLMSDSQQILATAGSPLTVSRPHEGWSEQDPQDWWKATLTAIQKIQQQQPRALSLVRSIGLSGQMHGAVLLDEAHQVLRPAILWNDVRSEAECIELTQRVPELHALTGNLAMPGFTAPKLIWVAKHEPDLFQRIAKVLLPKDWLRYQLTGLFVSEMSDAAGTLWLDVAQRNWSNALLCACNLSRSQMPELVEGSVKSGTLLSKLAQQWDMSSEVIVAGGAGDNAASAIGMGCFREGDGFLSLGTSGVLFVANNAYRPNPQSAVHTFCHALPQRWHQMSVMLSAASCLSWVTRLTHAENEGALLAEVEQWLTSGGIIDRQPIFLPYLSGERTPHNDAQARGVFFGLTHDTQRAQLAWSVLEGVAFAFADGYAALQSAGTTAQRVFLVGGGARSLLWGKLLASCLDLTLTQVEGGEAGAALGAARLGLLADQPNKPIEQVLIPPPTKAEILPDSALRKQLMPRYQRFRQLYPALKACSFHN